MNRLLFALAATAAGALALGLLAETNTLLALFMGALLGGTTAVAVLAFPHDLDYRERRVWPPRAR